MICQHQEDHVVLVQNKSPAQDRVAPTLTVTPSPNKGAGNVMGYSSVGNYRYND